MKCWQLLVLLGALAGCKAGIPDDAKTTVVSFADLDCSDCGDEMARTLVRVDGVYKTAFDRRRAEMTVVAEPELDVMALAQKNKPAGEEWRLVAGAGKGGYLPWRAPKDGVDAKEIAKDGEDVPDLAPHLVQGKVTIVDFSAKWCEPCRELDAHVLELLEKRPDLAYRKLDVGDWDTPLGTRYLKSVEKLPYVIVFDPSGKRVEVLSGLDLPKLDAIIAKAARAK
jgi:thiol-disulfide isomerase/thioredoxin